MAALDEPWEAAKIPLLGDAGTVNIVHFDMVHGRHSANVTEESRHMVKFLFTRDRDPLPARPGSTHDSPWPADDDHDGAGVAVAVGLASGRASESVQATRRDDWERMVLRADDDHVKPWARPTRSACPPRATALASTPSWTHSSAKTSA